MKINGIVLESVLPIFYQETKNGKFIFCRKDGKAMTEPKNLEEAEDYLKAIWEGLMLWEVESYLKNSSLKKLKQNYQFLEAYLWNLEGLGYKANVKNKKLQKELKIWERVAEDGLDNE